MIRVNIRNRRINQWSRPIIYYHVIPYIVPIIISIKIRVINTNTINYRQIDDDVFKPDQIVHIRPIILQYHQYFHHFTIRNLVQNELPFFLPSFLSQELFLLTNQATIRFRLLPERKTRARKWQKRRALSRRVAARRDGFSLDSASKKAPSLAVPSTRSKAWFQAGGTGRVGRGKTVFAVVENTDTMLAPPGVTSAGQNNLASSQLCTGSTL